MPAPRVIAHDVRQVVNGHGHACLVRRSGKLACWGDDTLGRLGLTVGPGVWFDLQVP